MTATLFSLTLTVLIGAADSKADKKPDKPRKPHPYAPSLPELSEEEEKKLDKIIDDFMLYDIGKLRGKPGAQRTAPVREARSGGHPRFAARHQPGGGLQRELPRHCHRQQARQVAGRTRPTPS